MNGVIKHLMTLKVEKVRSTMKLYGCQKSVWEQLLQLTKEGDGGLLLVQLPTGYGKTFLSSYIATNLSQLGCNHLIHVAPTRVLIEGIVNDMKKILAGKDIDVGVQMLYQSTDPFFLSDVIVTTYPSFGFNALRLPVAEIYRFKTHDRSWTRFGHFDFPVSNILDSVVVLDEVHLPLLGGAINKSERKVFAYLLAITLKYAQEGVPILYESATFPSHIINFLESACKEYGVAFKKIMYIRDKNFENTPRGSPSYTTFWVKSLDSVASTTWLQDCILHLVKRYLESSSVEISSHERFTPIAIVHNTVTRALNTFQYLKTNLPDSNILLLHSRFTTEDRELILEKLQKGVDILIATQTVEVGVNYSFPIMITDLAPAPSLIQRAGRLARKGGKGILYILPVENHLPYSKDAVNKMETWLNTHCTVKDGNLEVSIDWKYPQPRDGYEHGCTTLLNETMIDDFSMRLRLLKSDVFEKKGLLNKILIPHLDFNQLIDFARGENFNFLQDNQLISLYPVETLKVQENFPFNPRKIIAIDYRMFINRLKNKQSREQFTDSEGYMYYLQRFKNDKSANITFNVVRKPLSSIQNSKLKEIVDKVILMKSEFYNSETGWSG